MISSGKHGVSAVNRVRRLWFFAAVLLLIIVYIAYVYLSKYSDYNTPVFRYEYLLNDSVQEIQDIGKGLRFRVGALVEYTNSKPVWKLAAVELLYNKLSWTYMQLSLFVLLIRKSFVPSMDSTKLENIFQTTLTQCQPIASKSADDFNEWEHLRHQCFPAITQLLTLGGIPDEVTTHYNTNVQFNMSNPTYSISSVYIKPMNQSFQEASLSISCSIVEESRRKSLYQTMQEWIKLADQNKILWWITYGTLLGSWRDGNMIPYDSDMDISILGSYEKKVRQLATERKAIQIGKFNLVTRPGNHCVTNPGDRLDCQGRPSKKLRDTCSFCGPLARVFTHYGQYIDIYPVHLEVQVDDGKNPIGFGYVDEGMDRDEIQNASVLFPLRPCKYMGLTVPCPNDPETFLTSIYGKDFAIPQYRCSQESGKWVS